MGFRSSVKLFDVLKFPEHEAINKWRVNTEFLGLDPNTMQVRHSI